MDELVERAVQVNRIPGQNVYIGQALRKPDIPPFGRCTDADFFGLSAHYVGRHRPLHRRPLGAARWATHGRGDRRRGTACCAAAGARGGRCIVPAGAAPTPGRNEFLDDGVTLGHH